MASLATNASAAFLTSRDGRYRMLNRQGYSRDDLRFLHLSECAEELLSGILRNGADASIDTIKAADARRIKRQIETWAVHMAQEIPGYNDWPAAYRFTWALMTTADAVPGEDTTAIGTERDLHDNDDLFDTAARSSYALGSIEQEKAIFDDHAQALDIARRRLAVLDAIRGRFGPDRPMPRHTAEHFRKIYYGYSLREKLIGQTGYYNGSLELKAGLMDDFECNMYLIQMKLRRPDRLFPFKAPKQMAFYRTGPLSESPWNLQFSASFGFDEFGPGQIPHLGTNYIERNIVEMIRRNDPVKWKRLCMFLRIPADEHAAVAERKRLQSNFVPLSRDAYVLPRHLTLSELGLKILTLENIVRTIGNDEVKLKAFFTLWLELPWSETPLRPEHNPFVRVLEGQDEDQDGEHAPGRASLDEALCHLLPADIKDPRIADPDRPALLSLSNAKLLPHAVGRKANFILDPRTTAPDYRAKLERLSEGQLDHAFRNILAYPKHLSREQKIGRVVEQAVTQSMIWAAGAIKRRRPIYTGPSSHVVTYAEICLASPPENCKNPAGHPNLEQMRLTLLAALIGSNQHHTYDECMFTSVGIAHGDQTLRYRDRLGYRDLTLSEDPFVRDLGTVFKDAAAKMVRDVVRRFEELNAEADTGLPDWTDTGRAWFKCMFGEDLPELTPPPVEEPDKPHPLARMALALWPWIQQKTVKRIGSRFCYML